MLVGYCHYIMIQCVGLSFRLLMSWGLNLYTIYHPGTSLDIIANPVCHLRRKRNVFRRALSDQVGAYAHVGIIWPSTVILHELHMGRSNGAYLLPSMCAQKRH